MLALLGIATVLLLLAAILSRRASPLVALIAVPIATALVGGFGREIGKWITSGLSNIAPVVAMFVFAILFFGVMTDAGLFDLIVAGGGASSELGPRGSCRARRCSPRSCTSTGRAPLRFSSSSRPCCLSTRRSAWTAACWPAPRQWARGSWWCPGEADVAGRRGT
jgi:hypothetical protein